MTPHFSDELHLDTCAGKWCGRLVKRSDMRRKEGKRGWYCSSCFAKLPGQKPEKKA